MKVYIHELSGNSHKVLLMANILGLDLDIVNIDLKSGEHKKTEFLRKNPFGQVPVLEEEGNIIHDSNAIILYLATKYDNSKTYIPDDPILLAQIQTWLSKSANELANSIAAARRAAIFKNSIDHEDLKVKSHNFLQILEEHLSQREWFVGSNVTIADISLYPYVSHAHEGGISLNKYESIRSWVQRVESLKGFISFPLVETAASKLLIE